MWLRTPPGSLVLWCRFLLAAAVVSAPAGAEPGVVVDAGTAVVLGEQREISSRLFGITAFEGFPSVVADRDYRARVAAIRPGCIRLPGTVSWCAPPQYDPTWYDGPDAFREFSQVLLFGARYPIGRFLPVVRALGAEPMCSLGAPPPYLTHKDTQNPSDFDRWAAYCTGYVGLWRKSDPGLRLVQVWNEPNASWYLDPRANDKGTSAADLHIRMANKVARAIKARFSDVKVGGPVLCWPPAWPPEQQGMRPWYTWEMWTLPWLRDTRQTIDFFDFHVYDVAPDDFAVQAAMLANQALLAQGRRLPIWITESSTNLRPEELTDPKAIWNRRILPYERFLLKGVLPQADKVEGNLYHDLHARSYTLLPGSPDEPDPVYWLFWVLRDLRGRRVVADSADAEVVSYAAVEEDRLTVVLFNDSGAPKEVPLKVAIPGGYWTGPEVRGIGEGPDGACHRLAPKVAVERQGGVAAGTVSLPPHATASISFRMDRFGPQGQVRTTREHFGDRTLQLLQPGKSALVAIKLPQPLPQGAAVRLRLGLLGPNGEEDLAVGLNGRDVPTRPVALQEIAMDVAALLPTNRLAITLRQPADSPRLALAFASLVVETTR